MMFELLNSCLLCHTRLGLSHNEVFKNIGNLGLCRKRRINFYNFSSRTVIFNYARNEISISPNLFSLQNRTTRFTDLLFSKIQKNSWHRKWKLPIRLLCTSDQFHGMRKPPNDFKDTNDSKAHFQILEKEYKFWNNQQHLIKDIQETKAKVKEKVGEIIEKENIYTMPNLLCITRIAISPVLCLAVGHSYYSIALGLFIFAGFTDLIDGMIARSFPGQATRLGSFLDPLADKVLIVSLFLSLTYVGLIPLPLAGLIIYRDFLIIAAASYIRYKSVPPPITLSRYFDATHVTAQLSPTLVSKFNTVIQLTLIAASLAAPVMTFTDHYFLHAFGWFTAGTTFASGVSYIFSKDTYKILSKKEK